MISTPSFLNMEICAMKSSMPFGYRPGSTKRKPAAFMAEGIHLPDPRTRCRRIVRPEGPNHLVGADFSQTGRYTL
jgi:hypothetical protein